MLKPTCFFVLFLSFFVFAALLFDKILRTYEARTGGAVREMDRAYAGTGLLIDKVVFRPSLIHYQREGSYNSIDEAYALGKSTIKLIGLEPNSTAKGKFFKGSLNLKLEANRYIQIPTPSPNFAISAYSSIQDLELAFFRMTQTTFMFSQKRAERFG